MNRRIVCVETVMEYEQLVAHQSTEIPTVYCVPRTYAGPVTFDNLAVLVWVFSDIIYLMGNRHPELLPAPWDIFDSSILQKTITPNIRDLLKIFGVQALEDCTAQYYHKHHTIPDEWTSPTKRFYQQTHPIHIPLGRIVEDIERQHGRWDSARILHWLEIHALRLLAKIEAPGIGVHAQLFTARYPKIPVYDGRVYSQCNPYTQSGRITQSLPGIMLNSLAKDAPLRQWIRAESDQILVSLDFEAFHPRILSYILQFPLAPTPFYEQFGSSKADVKKAIFTLLYGYAKAPTIDHPFFHMVYEFKQQLAQVDSYPTIFNQVCKFNHENASQKLAHYVQMNEAEWAVTLIDWMLQQLPKEVKPILYIYDNIVFEMPKNAISIIKVIYDHMLSIGFPVRVTYGKTWATLKEISLT